MSSTAVTAQTGLLFARNQAPQSSQFQKKSVMYLGFASFSGGES